MSRPIQIAVNGYLLTFDDGPDPMVTPAVLDLLRKYNAKAIFFICGRRIENAPELLAKIVEEGHALGNHSFAHWHNNDPGIKEYTDDLKICQKMIAQLVSVPTKFFRAPKGSLRPAALIAPKKLSLRYIHWSVSVEDWNLRDHEEAKKRGKLLVEKTRPGDIVLLHDDNPCVLDILEVALPVWVEKGYALDQGVKLL
ncbi:MAG: polysaccharide deacetylase family protein [Thermoguttaceae bacterium]